MQSRLGERIGQGATADVHDWAPGQVLKLFKPGFPQRLVVHEANMIRAVSRAGGPAPDVIDVVTIDGRVGIVLPKLDGPSLLDMARSGAMTPLQTGEVLADLARALHQIEAPPAIYSIEQTMTGLAHSNPSRLPAGLAVNALAYLQAQPGRRVLCHADLHPGNVIMTAQGPQLIDWLGAIAADPAFDLAISQVIMVELAPHMMVDRRRTLAVNAALQSRYAALSGIAASGWTEALAFNLPIARVFALLTGSWPALRPQLTASVESSLQPLAKDKPPTR